MPHVIVSNNETEAIRMNEIGEKLYAERMKMLLERLSQSALLNLPKRSLLSDWNEAYTQKEERFSFGNLPYILGHVSEYNEDETRNLNKAYFIHNHWVYFISRDSGLHYL